MRTAILVAAAAVVAAAAERIPVEAPAASAGPEQGHYLQYDSGTFEWLSWGGLTRGVWFHLDDFAPGLSGLDLNYAEFWMYHHLSVPWDTSDFYAEIWSGDGVSLPEPPLLASSIATAVSMSPTIVSFYPLVETEGDFWVLESTVLSSGGWPSILLDGESLPTPHSWNGSWIEFGDYLIRCYGFEQVGLESSTWGSIKSIF